MKVKHILKPEEFVSLLRKGTRIKGAFFSLFYNTSDPQEKSLFIGVILAKKNISLAVRRNYIRRSIYAFLRTDAKNSILPGKYLVRLDKNVNDIKSKKIIKNILAKDLKFLFSNTK